MKQPFNAGSAGFHVLPADRVGRMDVDDPGARAFPFSFLLQVNQDVIPGFFFSQVMVKADFRHHARSQPFHGFSIGANQCPVWMVLGELPDVINVQFHYFSALSQGSSFPFELPDSLNNQAGNLHDGFVDIPVRAIPFN